VKNELAADFVFTQQSIKTFETCPMKFKRIYIDGYKWQPLLNEDERDRIERGNDFHLAAHRYFLNIDTGVDVKEENSDLPLWLDSLKQRFCMDGSKKYLSEYKLRFIGNGLRLEANYDLIIIDNSTMEIWDWKTGGEENNDKKSALSRMYKGSLQTMVYMLVLKENAKFLAGRDVSSEEISMNYWRPYPAEVLARIEYSNELHAMYTDALKSKTEAIKNFDYDCFDSSIYDKNCKYCEYEWLCQSEGIIERRVK